MNAERIHSCDIDHLNELQPQGWEDIRPYFYYYVSSPSCDPIKMCVGNKIAAVGTTIRHPDTAWLAHVIVHPDFRNQGLGQILTETLVNLVLKSKPNTYIWTENCSIKTSIIPHQLFPFWTNIGRPFYSLISKPLARIVV
jgi:GNAT superfamily N-acetyltransferase